jgi:heme O synthase-like polyprenyltransferase
MLTLSGYVAGFSVLTLCYMALRFFLNDANYKDANKQLQISNVVLRVVSATAGIDSAKIAVVGLG